MTGLDLAPDNGLLRGPRGRRVDRSDLGVLLADILALRAHGSTTPADAPVAAIGIRPHP